MSGSAVVTLLVSAALASCGGRASTPGARTAASTGEAVAHFSELTELIASPKAEVLARLGATRDDLEAGFAYEGLMGLSRVKGQTLPAWCFFRQGAVVMLYVGDEAWLAPHVGTDVLAALGPAEATLASRVGKGALMHVWPSRGLAVSMTRARDAIELLEVFPPTTLDTYRRDIWRDPGPFTK